MRILPLIDRISEALGNVVACLTVLMALTAFGVVLLRYVLGMGSIAMQESVIYMHSFVFLLGAGYTLRRGAHVRVDVFYRKFPPRTKAWVDSVGAIIFLMPVCVFLFFISLDYVAQSWRTWEVSPDPGGLPLVYILKTMMPLAAIVLFIQAVAECLRNLIILMLTGSIRKISS